MQKVQIPWAEVSAQLTEAVRTSPLSLPALAAAAKVQYHAVYRISREGAKNRGKNALKLCKFFGIALESTPKISAESLTAAVVETWDGTPEHGRLLIDLVRCTGLFHVTEKAPSLAPEGEEA